MRESIGLYKGKRNDNKEWVIGSLSAEYLKECGCVMISPTSDTCYKVIPETVGQYTGLPDKNKVKIFEWDIVESRASENPEDWKRWVVVWQDGGFEFTRDVSRRKKHKHEANTLCADEIELFGLVVIGNIHDSPELLKGGAENE